jgi:glycosyltransferase involved in cell wall biosynthesis
MNIFMAGTSFHSNYGGPAVSVSSLAVALADAGARVGLWAPDGSARTSDVVPTANGDLVRLTGSLDEALVDFGGTDVIHDNGLWLSHNHRIAVTARRRGIARIVSVRGMLEPWAVRHKYIKKVLAWQFYQQRDLLSSTLLHSTADSESQSIRSFGLEVPIVTIPNGTVVPDEQTTAVERQCGGPRVALFLSRLHPKKGLPMLIEAWARLRPNGWRLRIAGPNETGHRSDVEALVAHYGLVDSVSFLGPLEGKAKAAQYCAADLFVLPTYSENFGMVIAEALSHGLPVLTTQGAPWQHLEIERCGWWVETNVDAILAGLSEATSMSPEALSEMGRRGREMVAARYGWGPIAEQFLAAYEQAILTVRAGQSQT